MVADIDTFDSILCCIVFILSYILQNGDDSVDRKLENETMAAFVSYFSSSPALISEKHGDFLMFSYIDIATLWFYDLTDFDPDFTDFNYIVMQVQTLLQQIVSSYFELFWYSIRNFRTINFKQI
ncbi:hypothetical protein Godav_023734 [Gossypium davidsonii]|uniref:Uncharacterized protein n=1 Tax=Gossypium davidsonii TaxID=34287 RepID=A0A7J8STH8_GOSDV|nr:hypothetical protein [Gossypium davidsonii]